MFHFQVLPYIIHANLIRTFFYAVVFHSILIVDTLRGTVKDHTACQ